MRFFNTLLVGASALAAVVCAQDQPYFTWMVPASVKAGESYNVTYVASSINSPVTITLRKGPDSNNLGTVGVLTSSATGGSYQWTVASSLADGSDYALEITQGAAQPNYSLKFALTGGSASSSSSSSSASASTSSSTSSSSSSTATTTTSSSTRTSTSTHSSTNSSSTKTPSATNSTSTTGPTKVPDGAAVSLGRPMALLFGAVAVLAYLN